MKDLRFKPYKNEEYWREYEREHGFVDTPDLASFLMSLLLGVFLYVLVWAVLPGSAEFIRGLFN